MGISTLVAMANKTIMPAAITIVVINKRVTSQSNNGNNTRCDTQTQGFITYYHEASHDSI
jgi:hypothetical protein